MTETKEVLVVDDDPDMAETMVEVLREAGYSARSAGDGKQALEAVEMHMPSLILLDVLMPVMDGWQCAREVRKRYGRDLPIVVVTAAEDVRARAEPMDVNEVLPKPFELDDLLRAVERYAPLG
ncbi:MAG TPA: response regulator [Polyangiaceae bacterium]|nr:response regulator [Polyangiaceae bacterium]